MNLCATYDGTSITFEGSAVALMDFARVLEEKGGELSLQPEGPCELPTSGSRILKRLIVERTGLKVDIQVNGENAQIAGSDDKIRILAQNIRSVSMQSQLPGSRGVRPQLHVEYHPDHYFLSETAVPVVIVKSD